MSKFTQYRRKQIAELRPMSNSDETLAALKKHRSKTFGVVADLKRGIAVRGAVLCPTCDGESECEECGGKGWLPDDSAPPTIGDRHEDQKMPGPVSDSYKGPKDGRVPTWMLRGGPGQDWPCNRPEIIECALSECQHLGRCRLEPARPTIGDRHD